MPSFQDRFFPDVAENTAAAASGDSWEVRTIYCRFDDSTLRTLSSTMHLFAMLAAAGASVGVRHAGRRPVLFAAATSSLVGVALQTGGPNVAALFVARAFLGIAAGLANVAAPMTIAEMAPVRLKGALGSLFQLCITLAIFVGSLIAFLSRDSGEGWRITFACGAAGPIVVIAGLLFAVPESPVRLLQAGHAKEAERVLVSLRGVEDVSKELSDVRRAADASARVTLARSFRACFSRVYLPSTTMAIALPAIQQLAGIVTVEFYLPVLFESVGTGRRTAMMYAVIVNAIGFGCTFFAVAAADRSGRRTLLVLGGLCMAGVMAAIAAVLGTEVRPGVPPGSPSGLPASSASISYAAGAGVLTLFGCFVFFFACSDGPLCWLIPSEITGVETRPAAVSVATAGSFAIAYIFAQAFVAMLCAMRNYTFALFAGCTLASVVFIYFFLPETKHVPVERVQVLFAQHPLWGRVMGPEARDAAFAAERAARQAHKDIDEGKAERADGSGTGTETDRDDDDADVSVQAQGGQGGGRGEGGREADISEGEEEGEERWGGGGCGGNGSFNAPFEGASNSTDARLGKAPPNGAGRSEGARGGAAR